MAPHVAPQCATASGVAPGTDQEHGRRRHYGEFYGLQPLPPDDGRPLVVVHANCQGESLRVLLAAAGAAWFRTVRVPPVHELGPADLVHLARTLAAAQVLVSQPVRPDYRDLRLGTEQVASAMPRGGVVVLVPVVRFAGLFPYQSIVRAPGVGDPPVVPYHDLRTLVQAATGAPAPRRATAAAYREIERQSVAELRSREQRAGSVVASDLLRPAGAKAAHTINHPANQVLRGLAARVLQRLGHRVDVDDPGRTLLDSVHTPLASDVLDALGLDGEPRDSWVVDGAVVDDDVVRRDQLRWYARHPEVVQAGLRRHHDVVRLLGLG